ncbi:MAG: hypothetical protein DYG89_40115 [Caldilinea sp. CFX5]|nr:hypothetical protein [Caldilinea sp. CFX5]
MFGQQLLLTAPVAWTLVYEGATLWMSDTPQERLMMLQGTSRQGFGSAVSHHLLQEAKNHGYQQAYVWSSAMGKGIYQGVGFVPIALGMREYSWQKAGAE